MENHAWPNSLNLQNIITSRLKSDAIFYSLRDINDNKLNWAIVQLRDYNVPHEHSVAIITRKVIIATLNVLTLERV